ncbi:hypothetical protein [Uliginosibacterium gangwonense]|uniref:hypothetical protein n=1 Tax=Uliginosibacterium gangwonense TaxID=392736 RepID=UPI00037AB793|nr:hypothetical protein [Uliginosibacterium gangwonense]
MSSMNTLEMEERTETIEELADLIVVVQEMGHRLAYETHGDDYCQVQELNELLHQVRITITQIKQNAGIPTSL